MVIMQPCSCIPQILRVRLVRALKEGMLNSTATRLFDLSLSSVKRNATIAHRGASLAPRKGGGSLPEANETTTRKLLEEDVKEKERPPATTVYERWRFLQNATRRSLSLYTVKRRLRRKGFAKK